MAMTIEFPGGAKVDALYEGFRIETDQPVEAGGDGAAPAPFDYFLASLGTCAGVYVIDFIRRRNLPAEGLKLVLDAERDPETRMITEIRLELTLPDGFPERYRPAILRAIDLCSVKKHLASPPRIRTVLKETPVASPQ